MSLALAVLLDRPACLEPFLAALAATDEPDLTIEIAHAAPLDEGQPIGRPGVRFHHRPDLRSPLRLWGVALAAARGDAVAVLDASAPPRPGWLGAAREVSRQGRPLAYGPVLLDAPADDPAALSYLIEYAQFHPPARRDFAEVPGNNLVIRRDLLPPAERLLGQGFEKTFWIWQLAAERGIEPEPVEALEVGYRKWWPFGPYVRRRFHQGRCFAARRAATPGQPPWWLCLGFTPLLPPLRIWRIWQAARRAPALARVFWRQLWRIGLAELAWSFGEALGYASGPGSSSDRLD